MTAADERKGSRARGNGNGRCAEGRNGNGINGRLKSGVLYRWHRIIGGVSAILVVILAVTGPLLIHAEALDLHERWVTSDVILKLYDAAPAQPPRGLETEAGWLVSVDDMLILGRRVVAADAGALKAVVPSGGMMAAATRHAVILMTPDGRIIERLGAESLPGTITRAGRTTGGRLVIDAAGETLAAGRDYLTWQPADGARITWLKPTEAIPAEVAGAALTAYRNHRLTLHRLMVDIHSGRILGAWGPYLMDGAAVALLLLAASGFINARRRRIACRRQSPPSDA